MLQNSHPWYRNKYRFYGCYGEASSFEGYTKSVEKNPNIFISVMFSTKKSDHSHETPLIYSAFYIGVLISQAFSFRVLSYLTRNKGRSAEAFTPQNRLITTTCKMHEVWISSPGSSPMSVNLNSCY